MGMIKATSVLPQAVIELINRMTPQEKRELSRLFNWKELEQLEEEKTSRNDRRRGDPKIYIGTTPKGLNVEIPKERVNEVLLLVLKELSPTNIAVFLSGPQEFKELKLLPEKFQNIMTTDPEYFSTRHALIEIDDNEIFSAAEGCMSMVFSSSNMLRRRNIAAKILNTCGYSHKFISDRFYAIVWDKELQVEEDEENG